MSDKFQYYDESFMAHGSIPIVMGTRFDLVMLGKNKTVSATIWKRIVAELQRLDKMLNRFDSKSEISFINTKAYNEAITPSEEVWNILNDCKRYHKITTGLFDITLNDFSQLYFNEKSRTIQFKSLDISLDLGGYAKGYALERIKIILDENEVDQAFVDFGNSSILGIGHHPYGQSWQVSIPNPFKREEVLGIIDLIDNYLSMSGNSPTHTAHIINPTTKEFNNDKKVVSIISKNAVEAEILSTVLMVAPDNIIETLRDQLEFDFKIYYLS